MRKIQNVEVKNKKVLIRVDFNVPLKNGAVVDDERIKASMPTVKYLLKNGASVGLCSHLGRPEGDSFASRKDPNLSLKVIVPILEKELGQKVVFVPDCIGASRDKAVANFKPGEVLLLENLRFYPEEEKNEPKFAEQLASGFDLFVNDAFSASHRAHASIVGVTKFLPGYAGLSVQEEVKQLSPLLSGASKPYMAISAGAKISDKIDVLKSLIEKVDVLAIGGAMATTFLAAEGYEVGKSLYEENQLENAEDVTRLAEDHGAELMLPDDVVVAKSVSEKAGTKVKTLDEIEKSDIIVDIGPKTVAKYSEPIKFASTIFWNGPVGIAEYTNSAKGTVAIAKIVATSKARSIIGGGDTVAAVSDLGLKFDYISSGGGATLEFVSGHKLPGLEALE